MPAHSSLQASDSHNSLKSSILPGGFSALSLKPDAMRHTLFITKLNIHTPRPQLQPSTTARQSILNPTPGCSWARCQLSSGIKGVSVASKLRKSLTLLRVVFIDTIPWRSQNSMADSSTTTAPILNLIAGDCRARRQLRSGIKNVSVASKLRKSLTFVTVVFIDTLAIPELDGRLLHNHCSDPESDCGRLLGSAPATQWYKVLPCRIKAQEIAVFCGGCIRYHWR